MQVPIVKIFVIYCQWILLQRIKVQMQFIKQELDNNLERIDEQKQEIVRQIISKFRNNQNVNGFFILSNFIDFSQIRKQPKFIQILFKNHLTSVMQLFNWMLNPNQLIVKKQIKKYATFYPYQSKEFLKQNQLVYEQLYYAFINKTLQFSDLFEFLKPQKIDKKTICTSLGYFAQVFLPFARYDFQTSLSLNLHLNKNQKVKKSGFSILQIIPQQLQKILLHNCNYQPIFLFLTTVCFVNMRNNEYSQRAKEILYQIFVKISERNILDKFPISSLALNQQLERNIFYLQNIYRFLRQFLEFIDQVSSELNLYALQILEVLLKSQLIEYFTLQLLSSKKISLNFNQKRKIFLSLNVESTKSKRLMVVDLQETMPLGESLQFNYDNQKLTSQKKSPKRKHQILELGCLNDDDEDEFIQIILKIMSVFIQIYQKIDNPRQKIQINLTANSNIHFRKFQKKGVSAEQLVQLKRAYKTRIKFLFENIQFLNRFVYNQKQVNQDVSSYINFSTGQHIKMISFVKFNYFKLLYRCLIVANVRKPVDKNNCNPIIDQIFNGQVQLIIPIQKLHIMQIIKKYLSLNKWNNICHQLLQKICNICITKYYKSIKKSFQNDKIRKVNNGFLAYLVQNFAKRDFVFLDTLKFTSQGNIYSIYSIAKNLAYVLNDKKQFSVIYNQFEPWRKFICQDLKIFEQKIFPKSTKPQLEQSQIQSLYIKIDEAQTISRLIKNISLFSTWTYRQPPKSKNLCRSLSLYNEPLHEQKQTLEPLEQYTKKQKSKKIILEEEQRQNKLVKQQGSTGVDQNTNMKLDTPVVQGKGSKLSKSSSQQQQLSSLDKDNVLKINKFVRFSSYTASPELSQFN